MKRLFLHPNVYVNVKTPPIANLKFHNIIYFLTFGFTFRIYKSLNQNGKGKLLFHSFAQWNPWSHQIYSFSHTSHWLTGKIYWVIIPISHSCHPNTYSGWHIMYFALYNQSEINQASQQLCSLLIWLTGDTLNWLVPTSFSWKT